MGGDWKLFDADQDIYIYEGSLMECLTIARYEGKFKFEFYWEGKIVVIRDET